LFYQAVQLRGYSRVLVGPPEDIRELFDLTQVLGYAENAFQWPYENVARPTVEDEVGIAAGEDIELAKTVT
jgi:hypothetical protein